MENTNPEGKSLSELINEAEKDGDTKVLIVGTEEDVTTNAELILKIKMKHKIILVVATHLSLTDQERLKTFEKPEPFRPEPFKISENEILPFPETFMENQTRPWESQRKRQKLKGWQKGKK